MHIGLVLSGGGARAAYQVGVVRALAEITASRTLPFSVVVGVSAGAVTGCALATRADDFQGAAHGLWDLWSKLTPEQIYRTDAASLGAISGRWIRDLSLGGVMKVPNSNRLLDVSPMWQLARTRLPMERIQRHIAQGLLRGAALSATSYQTGHAISFFDGVEQIESWERAQRLGIRTRLAVEHVMASAALPVFFPPVLVDGVFMGDGGIRLTTPLSPAIHLGADRIIAVGIRPPHQAVDRWGADAMPAHAISMADIGGVLLDALFMDALEADLERVQRINRTLGMIDALKQLQQPLRNIPVLAIRPSLDPGTLAPDGFDQLPWMIRHLLRGLGADRDRGWELVSYLAFVPTYVHRLLTLGYEDTIAQASAIRAFLTPAAGVPTPGMTLSQRH